MCWEVCLHFTRNLLACPMYIVCPRLFVLPPLLWASSRGSGQEALSPRLGVHQYPAHCSPHCPPAFQSAPVHLGDAGVHWRCMRGLVGRSIRRILSSLCIRHTDTFTRVKGDMGCGKHIFQAVELDPPLLDIWQKLTAQLR